MSTPLDPAAKKAYETSYALFRVAAIVPSRGFAEVLENEALALLSATVSGLPEEAERALRTLKYTVALGRDTGNVHTENADLLLGQFEVLSGLLREMAGREITAADLDGIFSDFGSDFGSDGSRQVYLESGNDGNGNDSGNDSEGGNGNVSGNGEESGNGSSNDSGNGGPAKTFPAMGIQERQEVILARIRQSGNCRAKDLQEILPDLSERTLRYDLQKLIEQGKIERVGNGGPSSWYRVKP